MISKWIEANFEEEVEQLTNLEVASRKEIIVRHLVLIVVCCSGAYHFQLWFPIIWLAFYATASIAVHLTSTRLPFYENSRNYTALLSITFFQLLIFRGMILYLWFYPDLTAHYISMLMMLASMRLSINLKSHVKSYMMLHAAGDLSVFAILSFDFLFLEKSFEGSALVGIALICMIAYYTITLRQSLIHLRELKLLEERTRQSQKMEAVGRLTGGVAHDFNNILTVVMGNLELYEVTDDSAEQRELITQTRDAARRAADLTSQLLAFSHQSRLKQDVHTVGEVFKQVNILTSRLLPANITLNVNAVPQTPPIRVDKTQLEVALVNLIINARDAMPDGGTLEMEACELPRDNPLHPDLDDSNYVCIHLVDQGGGIADEIIDKVTEPFFTTKPVGKGSGLGLSMVKGFAEQSGGFLNITTIPKVSTCVQICLPGVDHATDQEMT